jgi:hypothetical protein
MSAALKEDQSRLKVDHRRVTAQQVKLARQLQTRRLCGVAGDPRGHARHSQVAWRDATEPLADFQVGEYWHVGEVPVPEWAAPTQDLERGLADSLDYIWTDLKAWSLSVLDAWAVKKCPPNFGGIRFDQAKTRLDFCRQPVGGAAHTIELGIIKPQLEFRLFQAGLTVFQPSYIKLIAGCTVEQFISAVLTSSPEAVDALGIYHLNKDIETCQFPRSKGSKYVNLRHWKRVRKSQERQLSQ